MMLPAQQKTYYGFDDSKGAVAVFVSSPGQQMRPLPLRCDIVNHSPTGFSWGYAGSGPAQLALAILADYFGCAHAARPAPPVVQVCGDFGNSGEALVDSRQRYRVRL
jgi:hypothetical protein